jgi:hypothetical protein
LAYTELLDRVLEDQRLTSDEFAALAELARAWGLSQEDVVDIHRSYLTSLIAYAYADQVLTAQEREMLGRFAELLGSRVSWRTSFVQSKPGTSSRRNERLTSSSGARSASPEGASVAGTGDRWIGRPKSCSLRALAWWSCRGSPRN